MHVCSVSNIDIPAFRGYDFFTMNSVYGPFGALIRKARADAGLTQMQLAQRVNLGRTAITNIERGNQGVALHQLFELAAALGRSPCDLLPRLENSEQEGSSQFSGLVDDKKNQELLRNLMERKA